MKNRLARHKRSDLLNILGADWIKALKSVQSEDFSLASATNEQLSLVIDAVFGNQLLENQSARFLLLLELPEDKLAEAANTIAGRSYAGARDNALLLASQKWQRSSPLAELFVNELDIDADWLPEEKLTRRSSEYILGPPQLPPLPDYQAELLESVRDALSQSDGNFLVQMPTGAGKTRVMMEAISSYLNSNDADCAGGILWLAHSEELLEQAWGALSLIWAAKGTRALRLNRLYSSFNPSQADLDNSVTFASLQKVGRIASDRPELLQKLGCFFKKIVIDEAHKATAPTYRRAIEKLSGRYGSQVVGITATPGRGADNDIANRELASVFSGRLLSPELGDDPIEELRRRGILSRINRIVLSSGYDFVSHGTESVESGDDDFDKRTLAAVGRSSSRNRVIVDAVVEQVRLGKPTLIFACSIDHAKTLSAALALKGIRTAYLDNETSPTRRRRTIAEFQNGTIDVLINFGILSTGFDAPKTGAVVIARPTKSIVLYSQMVGRGLRGPKVGGNAECTLIDLEDNVRSHGSERQIYSYFDALWNT